MHTKLALLIFVATLVGTQTLERFELEEYKEFKKTLSRPVSIEPQNYTRPEDLPPNYVPKFETQEQPDD